MEDKSLICRAASGKRGSGSRVRQGFLVSCSQPFTSPSPDLLSPCGLASNSVARFPKARPRLVVGLTPETFLELWRSSRSARTNSGFGLHSCSALSHLMHVTACGAHPVLFYEGKTRGSERPHFFQSLETQ